MGTINTAASAGGFPMSGDASPCTMVSITRPSVSTTEMPRATPDENGGADHALHSLEIRRRASTRAEPADHTDDERRDEEESRELVEPPVVPEDSHDVRRERRENEDENENVSARERVAGEENDHEDFGTFDEPARNGEQRAHGADRGRRDVVVRAGDDEAATADRIVAPLELAGREKPRERCRDDDAAEQKDDRVWQARRGHDA
jgi:hypothetical protein